jgi:flavin-dependent dehydrogenase
MERCDVLIVGGGPAGSSCAWRLAGSGLDVLVLDRKPFPRDKTCAGWVTPQIVEELKLDLDDYRRGRVLEPITGFTVGMIGGAERTADYGRPISYAIRRCEFDHYLLQRAGARLLLGEGAKLLERTGDGWLVNGRIHARLLVGAGGHFCPVARMLGAKSVGGVPVVAAQEIEHELTEDQLRRCPIKPGVPNLAFCADLRGYGWYYRKGNFLNVGLGREDDRNLSDHVADYVALLKEQGRIPHDLPAKLSGHAYLLYPHSPRPLVGDAALLVGDAAGMAYTPSGEGIRPAVETGLLAADVIAAAAGDYRPERLREYAVRVDERFGKRDARSLGERLPAGLQRFLARRLMAWGWFSRNVVVDRWFLRAYEPALFPNGAAFAKAGQGVVAR